MADYMWHPIEQLGDKDRDIDLAEIRSLYNTWHVSKRRLQESSPQALKEFTARLVRRLSIETGILERIYDLDRGTTEALVQSGFAEELVAHSSTNMEPARLIDTLRSQEAAIQLVMDCVSGNRPLTKSVIHELHATLTKNQDTTTAVDQFGNRREIPLLKGAYKQQPNNPKRIDGSTHEYCPPVHVESEMDNLVLWFETYADEDPITVASWLHHRFAQIHPYQDGNGRVARAITTMVLLRTNLLPLVIDRDIRSDYITSLESADAGDLTGLAQLFARLERTAILQALSVDADAEISEQRSVTAAVIQSLGDKFNRRREARATELRGVNDIAVSLRAQARRVIETYFNSLADTIGDVSPRDIHIGEGGPERDNQHWYKYEVTQTAREAGKFANFLEPHYFIKATIRVDRECLTFVSSFHHIGRDLTGIMEATAFARLESYEDSDERQSANEQFFVCSMEPFVFTYQTNIAEVTSSFVDWLDRALAVSLKEYGDRL